MQLSTWLAINLNPWEQKLKDWAYVTLRVLVALLMLRHGFDKLINFSDIAPHFVDPLGLGPTLSLILVVGSEFFASLFLLVGFLTRWSALTTFITMIVAAFITHGPDPFDKKELALLYAVCYLFFMLAGGGKYSIDRYLKKYIG